MVTKGERGGEINSEFETNRHILLYIRKTNSKVLLVKHRELHSVCHINDAL